MNTNIYDIDTLLEHITVFPPGMWDNGTGPDGWYAVAILDGIIAYFADETDAFRFRLDTINRIMNP